MTNLLIRNIYLRVGGDNSSIRGIGKGYVVNLGYTNRFFTPFLKKPKHISAIITAITGDRVIVGKEELWHAMKHFMLPEDIFLELLERILKEPDKIYLDEQKQEKTYYLFYQLFDKKYILAVVKIIDTGAYFASMYPTGNQIRPAHKKLKKLTL